MYNSILPSHIYNNNQFSFWNGHHSKCDAHKEHFHVYSQDSCHENLQDIAIRLVHRPRLYA